MRHPTRRVMSGRCRGLSGACTPRLRCRRRFSMNGDFALKLRAMRNQKGWTQDRLASIAGVTERTIQRAEAGGPVALDTFQGLASAFDSTVEELRKPLPTEEDLQRD